MTSDHQSDRTDETMTGSTAEAGDPFDGAPRPGAPDAAAPPEGDTGPAVEDAGQGDGGNPQEMTDDLAKAQRDLVELTGDLQRLQAEYVNYKRRVDRDRELVKENARFAVLSALLPVLDDIDRAREHGEVEGGFKAVADALERVVAGMGLEKFGEPGDEFDPNLHEALMHSHSPDVTTTTCQNIVHAGYRIGDRVVRPARVTVVDPEPAGDNQ
ncbi:MAG: nucleotide exchange factor GrpE [Nocardioidaceae bacterium]